MPLVKRRVANPTPAVLAFVNGTRGKSMAAKKRTTRRTATKRRATATVRSRASSASFRKTTRRKSNPTRRTSTKRRSVARRRNPSGFTGEVIDFTVAGVVLGIVQPMIQPVIARFIPLGQFTAPVSAGVAGYGVGWLAEKFAATRRFGRPLKVLAVATAAIGVVTPIVRGFMSRPAANNGMNGIGIVTGIPPRVVAPPLPPAKSQSGVNGLSAIPGRANRFASR